MKLSFLRQVSMKNFALESVFQLYYWSKVEVIPVDNKW